MMKPLARSLAFLLFATSAAASAESGTIAKADLEVIFRSLTSPQHDMRVTEGIARALNLGSSGQLAQLLTFQALDGKVHYFVRLPKNGGYVLGVKETGRPLYALRVTSSFKLQTAIANHQQGPIIVPLAEKAPITEVPLIDAQAMLARECEWWTVYATVRR